MEFKKIGVLGGMGPEASANFYYKVIYYCQKKYNAVQDTDYPSMIIYSLPLIGFDESGITDQNKVLEQLQEGISTLENAGCNFIVIPCNTVHLFIDILRKNCSIPILSIIEETVKTINVHSINKIGLLGSETTLKLNLYQEQLEKNDIIYLSPTDKETLTLKKLILEVMGGNVNKETKEESLLIAERMKQEGAKAIVLGCTELPVVITQSDMEITAFDTLQILAEAAVDYAKK